MRLLLIALYKYPYLLTYLLRLLFCNCWLGHHNCENNVSEMTANVSNGTLNRYSTATCYYRGAANIKGTKMET